MNKNTFRLIVVLNLLLAMGGIYDVFWADEITKKVIDYSIEVEPEWSDSKMYIFVGIGVLGVLFLLMSFIGLLVFWNPARHLYLAGFVAIVPSTLLAGVNVSSVIATMIYDTSTLLSGVILGLLYWSPVKKFFTDKSN